MRPSQSPDARPPPQSGREAGWSPRGPSHPAPAPRARRGLVRPSPDHGLPCHSPGLALRLSPGLPRLSRFSRPLPSPSFLLISLRHSLSCSFSRSLRLLIFPSRPFPLHSVFSFPTPRFSLLLAGGCWLPTPSWFRRAVLHPSVLTHFLSFSLMRGTVLAAGASEMEVTPKPISRDIIT